MISPSCCPPRPHEPRAARPATEIPAAQLLHHVPGHDPADGEQGAEIYSAATTRDQARIVFEEAKRMVGSSPALRRRVGVLINNLNVEASASKFMPLSSDASSMDGLNVHGAIIDELHAHKTRNVVDVLDTATGATPAAADLRDHHRWLRPSQHLLRAP